MQIFLVRKQNGQKVSGACGCGCHKQDISKPKDLEVKALMRIGGACFNSNPEDGARSIVNQNRMDIMNRKIAILYTTVGTMKDAEQLANLALSHNVAACVNIIPSGKSIYLWNGKIEQGVECYVIFKTTVERANALENLVIDNHPYDIPAVLKFTPEVSQKFFDYIINTFLPKEAAPMGK